jgi:hypothetical protein
MQPLLCKGGYPLPIGKGMKYICGFVATVSNTAAASRLSLLDSAEYKIVDDGNDLQFKNSRRMICDVKGVANVDGTLKCMFPEPIKVLDGVTINSVSANLVAGRTFLYVR